MYTMSESMAARGGQYEIGCTWWTDCILRIEEEYLLSAQVTTLYPTSDVLH